jgi:hypothetical protein
VKGRANPVNGASESAQRTGRRFLRWGVNLWLVFHLSAILAAASSAGPGSELNYAVWKVFQPYLQVLYLNHGFGFFAPEPVPSTLMDYELELPDGSVKRGRIPDHSLKPRLLYDRHLLLMEHMNLAPLPLQEKWYTSYARHLCHKYGAKRIKLTKRTHYAPSREMVRDGTRLDDPVTYEELFLGDFECGAF